MICTVFYSWQSDLPNVTNRGFIQKALEEAAKTIRRDETVKVEPVIDRDTKDVPGAPDISQTIFAKIENAQIFVCDVSPINPLAKNPDDSQPRPTPNPNVLVELGYAARALSWDRIILVCNTDFGGIESLPFDLRQKRTLSYSTQGDGTKGDRRRELQGKLEGAIRDILTHIENQPVPLAGPLAELFLASGQGTDATLQQTCERTIHSVGERPTLEERIEMEQNAILGIKPQPRRSTQGLSGIEALMAEPMMPSASALLAANSFAMGLTGSTWRAAIRDYIENDFTPYLHERDFYLNEWYRMVPLHFVLKNDGAAPIEGAHLIVRCSPQVTVRALPPERPDTPQRPAKPESGFYSISNLIHVPLAQPNSLLERLLPPDPMKPRINADGTMHWQPGDLQHHLPMRLPPIYAFVSRSDEDEAKTSFPIRFPYEIHGKNLPIPIKGELTIEVAHAQKRWAKAELEEEEHNAAQKQASGEKKP